MQETGTEELRSLMRDFIEQDGQGDVPADTEPSCAKNLVGQAIDYLKIAHLKVQSAEGAKSAAESELARFRQQVKDQVDSKFRDVEARMAQWASALAAAERKAIAAEQRAKTAEGALKRLEDELRTQTAARGPRLVRVAA
jgi:hypothetical protein